MSESKPNVKGKVSEHQEEKFNPLLELIDILYCARERRRKRIDVYIIKIFLQDFIRRLWMDVISSH